MSTGNQLLRFGLPRGPMLFCGATSINSFSRLMNDDGLKPNNVGSYRALAE